MYFQNGVTGFLDVGNGVCVGSGVGVCGGGVRVWGGGVGVCGGGVCGGGVGVCGVVLWVVSDRGVHGGLGVCGDAGVCGGNGESREKELFRVGLRNKKFFLQQRKRRKASTISKRRPNPTTTTTTTTLAAKKMGEKTQNANINGGNLPVVDFKKKTEAKTFSTGRVKQTD